MKPLPLVLTLAAVAIALHAQIASTAKPPSPPPVAATATPLVSGVYDWEKLMVTPNAKGARRAVFDGPTTTLEKIHCHITTLNPGEKSAEPSKHLQEEVIIVKEGLVEANWDGQSKTGGPGSVIFYASGATRFCATPAPRPVPTS